MASIMTTIYCGEVGWVINHEESINRIYSMVENNETGKTNCCISFSCPESMFKITERFVMDSHYQKYCLEQQKSDVCDEKLNFSAKTSVTQRKKRKRKIPLNFGEEASVEFHNKVVTILAKALEQLVILGTKNDLLEHKTDHSQSTHDNNLRARRFASTQGPGDLLVNLSATTKEIPSGKAIGLSQNTPCITESLFNTMVHSDNDQAMLVDALGGSYLIPSRSSFLMSDITCIQPLLEDGKKYDVIVLDPPWQNKSAKRKKMYHVISEQDLLTLPLDQLVSDHCLVAIWVTNKQKQHRFVIDEWFPKLKVTYRTHWFWIKVTKYGEPVVPLDDKHKRPYECLILGTTDDAINIPENQVLLSIPCALHSRKPHLDEILVPLVTQVQRDRAVNCLEMFARNLLPGWTSWGNEVLKHQHADFFCRQEKQQATDTVAECEMPDSVKSKCEDAKM